MANDPFDSLDNPQIRLPEFWGNVQIDTFYATLQKGVGKVPFDPQKDSPDKRVTAIDISILPISEQNIQYPVQRNMIAESKEWAGIVLPSIKALGLSARDLNGKWVHVKAKSTGGTYTNKQGELKEKTTLEFVRLFASEAECKADYLAAAAGGPNHQAPPPADTQQAAAPVTVAPANGNGNDKEKATAMQFLKVVVKNACMGQKDLKVIQDTISLNVANMPLINKFYTVDSPETIELIMASMAPF
jgi:hypothetical protein